MIVIKYLKNFYNYKDLLEQLVLRDIKLKYRRSFLGYLWSVLNPLMIMVVMTIVFSTMFNSKIENYPVYLLTGRSLFDFLTTSTNHALGSIVGNGALIKKTYVPKYIFTIAKITSALVDFVLSMGALIIVILVTGNKITPYFFLFPLVVIQIYVFCCGLGLFLAQFNVFFRDIQYIYGVITTAWMYLTPLFYPIESLQPGIQFFIKAFNPLYYYVAQFRDLIYYGRLPGSRIFFGGIIMAVIMLIIGIITFRKNQDKFILYI